MCFLHQNQAFILKLPGKSLMSANPLAQIAQIVNLRARFKESTDLHMAFLFSAEGVIQRFQKVNQ